LKVLNVAREAGGFGVGEQFSTGVPWKEKPGEVMFWWRSNQWISSAGAGGSAMAMAFTQPEVKRTAER
jgi:hypothetical protein